MSNEFFQLPDVFDAFPDAVFFIRESQVLYRNQKALSQFSQQDEGLSSVFWEHLQKLGHEGQIVLPQGTFLVSNCDITGGKLFLLHPVPKTTGNTRPVYANVPAQLRQCLHTFSATVEQLNGAQEPARQQDLFVTQTQILHRLLRLTRQIELSQEQELKAYPLRMVNFTSLCQNLCRELTERLGDEPLRLTVELESKPLLISGNYDLLEQLVLSLLSNAMKSCGRAGPIGIRLQEKSQRAMLSIWDDGPGIPNDRLQELFIPKDYHSLPLPSDGSGLDLWIARQITLCHDAVIMAGNRPEGGAEFTASFPLTAADRFQLHNPSPILPGEDLSNLLIALSDVLPTKLYTHVWKP